MENLEKIENFAKIDLLKNGKLVEYKLRIFTAKVYAESMKILQELKTSQYELDLATKAIEYKETENISLIKEVLELQNKPIDVEIELHNYNVFCKLLEYNLETKENFTEDFWLEQDKEKIENFIVFFRKSKKLSRN